METLESTLVAPVEETPSHSIWLSNLDLLVARAHTPTVYFYRPAAPADAGGGGAGFFEVEVLKKSLARALVPFYPLAGRLDVDGSGRIEIRCTGEGVLFVVARSDAPMDDFGDFAPSEEMRRLLVPSAESGHPPCILVMFQITFFSCGGVCLGAAVHHTAADGLGALHFVNSWADIARGVGLAASPLLDRTLLCARSPATVLFDHVEYSQNPDSSRKPSNVKPPFDSAIFKLSKNQINLLKAGGGKRNLSTFKAVVAHVWRSACKARKLADDQDTRLYMTADARTRLKPPLPAGYVGNAIFRTSAAAKVREIVSNSLEIEAGKINEATARLDDEFIRSLIDFLELKEDVRGLQKGSWVMPATDLWVISWQGLPIYDADFGWGKPAFMGRACLQFSGLVYISQSPDGGGGLTVAVAMEPENMTEFKKVLYEDLAEGREE